MFPNFDSDDEIPQQQIVNEIIGVVAKAREQDLVKMYLPLGKLSLKEVVGPAVSTLVEKGGPKTVTEKRNFFINTASTMIVALLITYIDELEERGALDELTGEGEVESRSNPLSGLTDLDIHNEVSRFLENL